MSACRSLTRIDYVKESAVTRHLWIWCVVFAVILSGEAWAQVVDVQPQVVYNQSHEAWLDVTKDGCGAKAIARLEPHFSPLSLIIGDAYLIEVSEISPPLTALKWFGVWRWQEKRGKDGKQPREEEREAVSTVRPGETYKIFLVSDMLSNPVELASGKATYVVEEPATVALDVSVSPLRKPDNPPPATRNLIDSLTQSPEFCATVAQAKIKIATLHVRIVRRPK